MPLWLIPMVYICVALTLGIVFLRFESLYLNEQSVFLSQLYFSKLSIASTQAGLSAIASGMLALTAIVFTVAYITAQFNSVAYSPRVASLFVRDPALFHTFGIFNATFVLAVTTLGWVDRGNTGFVPMYSTLIVLVMVVASMLAFARLVRGVTDLQITNTLHKIGDHGRTVLRETFSRPNTKSTASAKPAPERDLQNKPISQTLRYTGIPRSIGKFDEKALIDLAQRYDALIEIECAVGDTLVYDTKLLDVRGASRQLPENELLRAVHLTDERTFEQDPKYPIRLLVDIAIKALSPAVNDPTTAVQAIDQIEDLLRRLGRRNLDDVHAADSDGIVRLSYPTPNWEDFLSLSFDEIRQYGSGSVQVMRRLRSALVGVAESISEDSRIAAVERYVAQLNQVISRSVLDEHDRAVASQQDRQGLGISRRPSAIKTVT